MPISEEHLIAVAADLKKGVSPQSVSVQTFLQWFGAERRGWRVVNAIRQDLARHSIVTKPDFETAWYYGAIGFAKEAQNGEAGAEDPTVRLSLLEAANRSPTSVAPDESLAKAVSTMIAKDFSQLPVMIGTREVKGLLSWRSIGSRLAVGRSCKYVRDCMDKANILASDTSLFEAIEAIAKEDCFLVQAPDKTICGIVTATDLNEQFLQLAEPFLLVGEIEQGIRLLLHGKFSAKELEAAKLPGDERPIDGITDLTIGGYIRLVQDDAGWSKVSLAVDRKAFCAGLDRVRQIRNDVMHFNPEGIDTKDLQALREFAAYLRRLRSIGAM